MPRKRNMQIAKRLIGHTAIGLRHYFLGSQRLCFKIFSSNTNRRTLGIYSNASGLALLLGRPAQIVSSFNWICSTPGLPNTIAPNRPLPSGSASVQT